MPPRQSGKARARPKASRRPPPRDTNPSSASMSLLEVWQEHLTESFWPAAFDGLDLSQDARELIRTLLPGLQGAGPHLEAAHSRRLRRVVADLRSASSGVPMDKILGVLMDGRVSAQRLVVRFLRSGVLPKLGRELGLLKTYQRQGRRRALSAETRQALQRDITRIAEVRDAALRYVGQAGHYDAPRRATELTPQVVELVDLLTGLRPSKNQVFRDVAVLLNTWHGTHLTAEQVRLRYQSAT